MTEWDNKNAESTEQIGGRLLEFVEQAEFGSPQYQAVSDYLFLKQSENSLQIQQQNATSNEDDPERKTYWESQERISQQKIAILQVSIYQNQSRIKGYDAAYTHIGIGFE